MDRFQDLELHFLWLPTTRSLVSSRKRSYYLLHSTPYLKYMIAGRADKFGSLFCSYFLVELQYCSFRRVGQVYLQGFIYISLAPYSISHYLIHETKKSEKSTEGSHKWMTMLALSRYIIFFRPMLQFNASYRQRWQLNWLCLKVIAWILSAWR